MWEANSMLIFNTREVYENVLQWAYACALVPSCIEPTRKLNCHFGKGEVRKTQHANCHRYDQSLFNILLANWWGFERDQYTLHHGAEMIDIIRSVTKRFKRNKCPALNQTDYSNRTMETIWFLGHTWHTILFTKANLSFIFQQYDTDIITKVGTHRYQRSWFHCKHCSCPVSCMGWLFILELACTASSKHCFMNKYNSQIGIFSLLTMWYSFITLVTICD